MNADRVELARMREQGAAARRAGKPRRVTNWGAGNLGAGSERKERLNDAWLDGWDAEEAARAKR